jgi:hypothetical protein
MEFHVPRVGSVACLIAVTFGLFAPSANATADKVDATKSVFEKSN